MATRTIYVITRKCGLFGLGTEYYVVTTGEWQESIHTCTWFSSRTTAMQNAPGEAIYSVKPHQVPADDFLV